MLKFCFNKTKIPFYPHKILIKNGSLYMSKNNNNDNKETNQISCPSSE